ncbi:exopolyphosphatase [Arcticibacter sp.]|uniref:Ppx/GppA phosphatase family protein n=1 Tax=Arcticibacter sp. TaxID=1872630 RepID=UPI00389059BF
MNNPIAVLDLGTNTFHLLIAELNDDRSINEIFAEKKHVKLGEGGITEGRIVEAAFNRGLEAMQDFKRVIDQHKITEVYGTGTAALRTAANGHDFVEQVRALTGISVDIIDGNKEASLIYGGVSQAVEIQGNAVIMDIGGGSVEFIFCNHKDIQFKKSYPIGAARLMALFHKSDPINSDDIFSLHQHLEEQLTDLRKNLLLYQPETLIGSAGAFETFTDLAIRKFGMKDRTGNSGYSIEKKQLQSVIGDIILSTHEERAADDKISPVRVDMIVTAAVLTSYILAHGRVSNVLLSTYALKEGLLYEKLG